MGRTGATRKFFKTPKGLLILILGILIAIALPGAGIRLATPGLFGAVGVAGLMDAIILRARRTRWEFPSGAILTAMIVVMILSPQEPWYVGTTTAAVAIVTKYLFRTRAGNVFNPAALAIVVLFFFFDMSQNWWGALPEATPAAQVMLVAGGVFIADRVNRIPLVLAFLGTYYLLFTLAAFVSDPAWVSEVFRSPDLQAVLYFAFFILTDPPTSPVGYADQLVCGVIVGVVSYGIFEWIGAVYYLLAGVLAGNVWEAWRRANRRAGNTFPRGIGVFLREITFWRTTSWPSSNLGKKHLPST